MKPSYFVGSRPNYTHQMIDFLPNLLLRNEIDQIPQSAINIIEKRNSILDQSLARIGHTIMGNRRIIELADLGLTQRNNNHHGWNIKCIRFKELYIARHISIFKSFSLIRKSMNQIDGAKEIQNNRVYEKDLVYLSRGDKRIRNQNKL